MKRCSVRFLKDFDGKMLPRQAGMDRHVYNKLLGAFRNEYYKTDMVNTTRGRINVWYARTCGMKQGHAGWNSPYPA